MSRLFQILICFGFLMAMPISPAHAQVIGGGGTGGYSTPDANAGSHGNFRYPTAPSRSDEISFDITAPGAAYPACYANSVVYLCREDGIVLCLPDHGIDPSLNSRKMNDLVGCKPAGDEAPPTQAEIEDASMHYDPILCGQALADGWNYDSNHKVVSSQCQYAVVLNVGAAIKANEIKDKLNRFAKQNHLPEFQGKHWGPTGKNAWRTEQADAHQDEMSHRKPRPQEPRVLPAKATVQSPQVAYLPPKPANSDCISKSGCKDGCNTKLDWEDETPRGHFCFDSMQCYPKKLDGSRGKTPIYFLLPAEFVTQKEKVDDVAFGAKGAGCFPGEDPKFDKRDKGDIKAAAAKNLYCYNGFGQLSCPFGIPTDGMMAKCKDFDIGNRAPYGKNEYCALVGDCAASLYRRDITACKDNCTDKQCYTAFKKDIPGNAITNQQYQAATATSEFTLSDVRDHSQAVVDAIEKLKTDVANSAVGRAAAARGENAYDSYFNRCYPKHIRDCKTVQAGANADSGQVQCDDPKIAKCDPTGNALALDDFETVVQKFAKTTPRIELESKQLANWKNFTDPSAGLIPRMGNMGGFSIISGNKSDDDRIGADIGRLTQQLEAMNRPGFGQSANSLIAAINNSMQVVPNGHGGKKAVITFTAPEGNNAAAGTRGIEGGDCLKSIEDGYDGRVIFRQFQMFTAIMDAKKYCDDDAPAVQTLPAKNPPISTPEDGAGCPPDKPHCKKKGASR